MASIKSFLVPPLGCDFDGDGPNDAEDNCPFTANSLQEDRGGFDSDAPDGVGDACQCGDLDNDGIVTQADVLVGRSGLAGASTASIAAPHKCNVSGALRPELHPDRPVSVDCEIDDLVILERASRGLPLPRFSLQQLCGPASP